MSLINGKWIANGSIPNASLQTITAANKVAGSAVQLSSLGAITDSNGLKVNVDGATLRITSSNILGVRKITSAHISGPLPGTNVISSNYLKKDGSVIATSTLKFSNARISGVLSAILPTHVVNLEQLQNTIATISGAGSEAGEGLYKTGIYINVGAGAGITVTSSAIKISGNQIKDSMLSGNISLNKLLSGSDLIRRDGTVPFTQPQGGVDPTGSSHLVTRRFLQNNYVTQNYVDTNFATSSDISNFITSSQIKVVKDAAPKLSANLDANAKQLRNVAAIGINTATPGKSFQLNDALSSDVVVLTSTGKFGVGTFDPTLRAEFIDTRANTAVAKIENRAISGAAGLTVSLPNNTTSSGYFIDLISGGTSKARIKPNGDMTLAGNIKIAGVISSAAAANLVKFYYNQLSDRPSAVTNNGLIAVVQATGDTYFAAGGVWNKLVKSSDLNNYLTSSYIESNFAQFGDLNQYITSSELGTELSNYVLSTNHTVAKLKDVQLGGLASGQVLKYNGTRWVNSSDNAGDKRYVENISITKTLSENMQLSLSRIPTIPSETTLVVIGGTTQRYGYDYKVSSNLLIWNNTRPGVLTGMQSDIVSGDVFEIVYDV